MTHKTRLLHSSLLAALFCAVATVSLLAQGPDGPPPGGPGARHHGPPPSPLFDALDTNHDGVISAEEMANAATSLKALLKNSATELKREDMRPPRPADRTEAAKSPATATTENSSAGTEPGAVKTDAQPGAEEHRHHHGPPPSVLFNALDANHDGAISTAEMDAAPAALKALLKNGATQLKREDLRPAGPPPQHQDN